MESCSQEKGVWLVDIVGRDRVEGRVVARARKGSHQKISFEMLSEYACGLRLIVSQTQVDFKAGEYVDPAYITYVQE